MTDGAVGKVVQVQGAVVDVEFPPETLPDIFDSVEIHRDGQRLVLEVQQHVGRNWVRCIAMDTTDGLRRGAEAIATGTPITVPVGPPTLGRELRAHAIIRHDFIAQHAEATHVAAVG